MAESVGAAFKKAHTNPRHMSPLNARRIVQKIRRLAASLGIPQEMSVYRCDPVVTLQGAVGSWHGRRLDLVQRIANATTGSVNALYRNISPGPCKGRPGVRTGGVVVPPASMAMPASTRRDEGAWKAAGAS
jgi:hypothetical protein